MIYKVEISLKSVFKTNMITLILYNSVKMGKQNEYIKIKIYITNLILILNNFRQNGYISHKCSTIAVGPILLLLLNLTQCFGFPCSLYNEIGLKLSAKSCSLKVNKPFSLFIFTVPLS